MVSIVALELDTTPPQVEVYAPSFTTRQTKTLITIQANEQLANESEIYIIDSQQRRIDLTFSHEGNSFVGEVIFSDYPLGMITLFARVKDTVDNVSDLISHNMVVVENEVLTMKMSIFTLDHELVMSMMQNDISTRIMENQIELAVSP